MKIFNINRLFLFLVLSMPFFGVAQLINSGTLYIGSGTKMSTVQALDNKASGDLVNDGELYVYSHYNNDGLATFTTGSATGNTYMRGLLGFQNISGSMPIDWYNIEFNNNKVQPAFHLSNEVGISGKANFLKGNVDNANYGGLVVFENNSTLANVNDDSHVEGTVRKNGNKAFVYPIGKQNKYRFFGISAPGSVSDALSGDYFLENADPLYPLANKAGVIKIINNQEYWTLDHDAGKSQVMITLSLDETGVSTPATIFASPQSAIHIVSWDALQKLWIDEGGVVDDVNNTITTLANVSNRNRVFTTARVDESELVLPCNSLVVYNAISPNDDGVNDYFRIDGLTSCAADNTVEIYNRWGVKVYETTAYNTTGNVFKGISEGRMSINRGDKLPVGTYFYVLNFKIEGNVKTIKKAGYLYINN
jgi:gliding motility-associated-like protein